MTPPATPPVRVWTIVSDAEGHGRYIEIELPEIKPGQWKPGMHTLAYCVPLPDGTCPYFDFGSAATAGEVRFENTFPTKVAAMRAHLNVMIVMLHDMTAEAARVACAIADEERRSPVEIASDAVGRPEDTAT